jgi:excinuclease UvrABC nuclease subunit
VDYARNVSQVERFLAGNRSGIIDELEEQMREAAA